MTVIWYTLLQQAALSISIDAYDNQHPLFIDIDIDIALNEISLEISNALYPAPILFVPLYNWTFNDMLSCYCLIIWLATMH